MTRQADKAATPRRRWVFVLWMVLAAVFFGGFLWLGTWQVHRLHWKLQLIHDVTARVHAPPVAAPGPAAWDRARAGDLQYLHVRLTGHYLSGKQTLVRGSSKKGYGFWVMTPLRTTRGFTVLVNRGYIPSDAGGKSAGADIEAPVGTVTLTGLLRASEPGGGFMRANKPRENLWYSRDVAAIAKARGLAASEVAPYFVDADATGSGKQLPVAGLTKIHFRNAHLGYAITWYLLALGTLVGAGILIRHERRMRRAAD